MRRSVLRRVVTTHSSRDNKSILLILLILLILRITPKMSVESCLLEDPEVPTLFPVACCPKLQQKLAKL